MAFTCGGQRPGIWIETYVMAVKIGEIGIEAGMEKQFYDNDKSVSITHL